MGNADATRETILEAALAEFAAYGIAGARVDRIAKTAGFNKNLIYVYFGNKEALFATVLEKNLVRVYDEIPFTSDDLPGYAAAVFDFAMAHPDLMRLMAWNNLEQGVVPEARTQSHADKLAVLEAGEGDVPNGDRLPARALLTVIMTIATSWSALSPFGASLDPGAGHDAELRDDVIRIVERILHR